MKKLIVIFSLSLLMFSCGKDVQEVEISIPCTDVIYLKAGDENFRVCNVKDLDGVADGTKIQIVYKEIDECKGESVGVCDSTVLLPEFKSWVKVQYQI